MLGQIPSNVSPTNSGAKNKALRKTRSGDALVELGLDQ